MKTIFHIYSFSCFMVTLFLLATGLILASGYGAESTLATSDKMPGMGSHGTIRDIDGNHYSTVMIGDQEWMAENLRTTRFRNGDPIPNVTENREWRELSRTETGSWAYNENDIAYGDLYGKLYNWYAVDDARGLCPEGWTIPSDEDWITMELYLGLDKVQAYWTRRRGRDINLGGKLKAATDLWEAPNRGANNESGFNALPGGSRNYDGAFGGIGFGGLWWTSTEHSENFAWLRNLTYFYTDKYRYFFFKTNGYSVRCIRH